MKMNSNEPTKESLASNGFDEPAFGDDPVQPPQSGKRIALNVFLYMVLLPTAVMLLAQVLVG